MRGFFVTGTDTGVGKTFVTRALARGLSAGGSRVAAIKPMESGCRTVDGALWADDAEMIAAAAGGWQPAQCLYRFAEPVAPGVAAEREGVEISLEQVAAFVGESSAGADVALVEGAGGWLVPLGGGRTMETLAIRLGLDVVVVARAGLGTINHTLLTVRAVEATGLSVAAVVMSCRPEDDLGAARSNRDEIERHWRNGVWLLSGDAWWPEPPRAVFHVER